MAVLSRHTEQFVRDILVSNPLETAIEWIGATLEPQDVFGEQVLIEWARAGDDPTEIFTEDQLQKWAKSQSAGDVCEEAELRAWAEANGYVKADGE